MTATRRERPRPAGTVQHDPAAGAGQHPRDRDLAGSSGCSAVRSARPATASTDGGSRPRPRRRRAARQPALDAGRGRSISQRSARARAGRARPRPRGRWPRRAAAPAARRRRGRARRTGRRQLGVVEQRPVRLPVQAERPHASPARVRSAATSSWSPPYAMFACHRGLLLGSPPVASCRVEIPRRERATSAIWLTSSSAYSAAAHSGGNCGRPSWKWLVITSDAGSTVYQHGAM